MIGNRVFLYLVSSSKNAAPPIDGILHKLDATGATIAPYSGDRAPTFYPMHRVDRIEDKGRAP